MAGQDRLTNEHARQILKLLVAYSRSDALREEAYDLGLYDDEAAQESAAVQTEPVASVGMTSDQVQAMINRELDRRQTVSEGTDHVG